MIPLDKCLNYHAENFGINIESICIFNATDAVSIDILSIYYSYNGFINGFAVTRV